MPKEFIYETAITIDHELDELRLDTTVTSIANAAKRAGFTETTRDDSKPYRRFSGRADQVRFRKPKGQRPIRGAAAHKAALKTLSESN
jgi:hypothetical protein